MWVWEDLLVKQGRARPGTNVVGLGLLGIVAILVLLPLVLEGFHTFYGKLWGWVRCRQARQLRGMVKVVVVMWMDLVSHCHPILMVSPWLVMLLAVSKERVVDLWWWHLHLVIFNLPIQEAIELSQTAERKGVWDGRFWIFRQLLCLVARVVAVARHQEAREKGTKDKCHQNASNQKSIVDAVIGFLQLWWSSHTFNTEKIEKRHLKLEFFWLSQQKKTITFSRANIGQVAAGADRLCLLGIHYGEISWESCLN